MAEWLSALVAAVVGGLIGALAVYLVFRGQRSERKTERFEEALADFMRAMSAKAADLRKEAAHDSSPSLAELPDPRVVSALDIVLMLADDKDYPVVSALSGPIAFNSLGSDRRWDEAQNFESWVAELRLWRRGTITKAKAIEDFNTAETGLLDGMKRNAKRPPGVEFA